MDRNEAKAKIQNCINDILKVASKLPPSELASLIGSPIAAPKPKAPEVEDKKPAKKGAKKGAVAKSSKAKPAKKGARKYNRRDPAEIAALRKSVLTALQGANGFVPASEIAKTLTMSLGRKIEGEELASTIGFLREKGYVAKKGDKINATYGVTTVGKAFTGEFEVPAPKAAAEPKAKPESKKAPAKKGEGEAPDAAPAAAE